MHFSISNRNKLVLDRNRRQIEMFPTPLRQQVAGKIVLMQALHHGDDRTFFLVIEA